MQKTRKDCLQIIIFNLLLACMMIQFESVCAMDSYLSELLPGSRASFKHWNLERSEVTGHSHYRYVELIKDGTRFIIEQNENTKPDGDVFTRKTLWFESNSGVPKWYEEEDLREDFRIVNTYSGKMMKTKLDKSGSTVHMSTSRFSFCFSFCFVGFLSPTFYKNITSFNQYGESHCCCSNAVEEK